MNMSLKQTGVSHPPNTKMLPCITHAECLHKLIKICSSQKETTHIPHPQLKIVLKHHYQSWWN